MRADPRALFWIRLDGDLPDGNEGAQYWGWWSMESVRLVKLIGRQGADIPSRIHACPAPHLLPGLGEFLSCHFLQNCS